MTGLYEVLASKVPAKKLSAPETSGRDMVSGLTPIVRSVQKTVQLLLRIAEASEK
jgi:hypothetical protein